MFNSGQADPECGKADLSLTVFKHFEAGNYEIGPSDEVIKHLENIPLIRDRSKLFQFKIVALNAFWIADFPVTNAEFERVFPKHKRCEASSKDEHPVVDITYFEALKYCEELSFRLPTSDEWMIAAGMPASTSVTPNHALQNFYPSDGTNVKGAYPPNQYGLYDFCGNVMELTCSVIPLPNQADIIVVKGGSWGTCKYGCYAFMEGYIDPLLRSNRVGFRVVRSSR